MASNVKVELIKIFSNSFPKKEKEHCPTHSEANIIIQIPKQGKYTTRKYRLISLMNIDAKILSKLSPTAH